MPPAPLDRPPESFRPDRREGVVRSGEGPVTEIDKGVRFECHVGAFNAARDLTTGTVRFEPGCQLAYHRHTFTESVTLLSGAAAMQVEGRRYELQPLDNLVIPPGLAHAAINLSETSEARLHIAMGTSAPSRELVAEQFAIEPISADSTGVPGRELLTRFATAARFEAGPGTQFIDFFNRDRMPGIEMSGGYGLFAPGGRLPAHIHDFDESICIIEGQATCVVEGRDYLLDGCATALEPRGRVHYFINRSQSPMAMIWVYAGPTPERIVVAEHNCTIEGNPWQ